MTHSCTILTMIACRNGVAPGEQLKKALAQQRMPQLFHHATRCDEVGQDKFKRIKKEFCSLTEATACTIASTDFASEQAPNRAA